MADAIGMSIVSQTNMTSIITSFQDYSDHLYTITATTNSVTTIELHQAYTGFLVWFTTQGTTNWYYSGFMTAIPGTTIYTFSNQSYLKFESEQISANAYTASHSVSATIIGIP